MKKIVIMSLFLLNIHLAIASQKRKGQKPIFVPAPLAIINSANTYLAQYQDSPSLTVLQKNDLLIKDIKNKIDFALRSPKLDSNTKQFLTDATKEWYHQLDHTKDDVQHLKTVVYKIYFSHHPEELEKEKRAIEQLLEVSIQNPMHVYYEEDKKALESILMFPPHTTKSGIAQKKVSELSSIPQTQAILARGKKLEEKFKSQSTTEENKTKNPSQPGLQELILRQHVSKNLSHKRPQGIESEHSAKYFQEPIKKTHASMIEEPLAPSQASPDTKEVSRDPQAVISLEQPHIASGSTQTLIQPLVSHSAAAASSVSFKPKKKEAEITDKISHISTKQTPAQRVLRSPVSLITLFTTIIQNAITTLSDWLTDVQSTLKSMFSWR